MLAQYLVLLGTNNSQKLKGKNNKAVNSPQASQEGAFHTNMLVEGLCIIAQKYILRQCFRLILVLTVF